MDDGKRESNRLGFPCAGRNRRGETKSITIKVAKAIGPIHFSDGDKKCEPMNVLKHLTSDYLRNKLGI